MSTPLLSTKFMVNCKEATQMVVLNELHELSFFQRLSLRFHLIMCKVCMYFSKQSKELNEAIKRNEQETILTLSPEKKLEIENMLLEQKNQKN
jgi:hypothetical protein